MDQLINQIQAARQAGKSLGTEEREAMMQLQGILPEPLFACIMSILQIPVEDVNLQNSVEFNQNRILASYIAGDRDTALDAQSYRFSGFGVERLRAIARQIVDGAGQIPKTAETSFMVVDPLEHISQLVHQFLHVTKTASAVYDQPLYGNWIRFTSNLGIQANTSVDEFCSIFSDLSIFCNSDDTTFDSYVNSVRSILIQLQLSESTTYMQIAQSMTSSCKPADLAYRICYSAKFLGGYTLPIESGTLLTTVTREILYTDGRTTPIIIWPAELIQGRFNLYFHNASISTNATESMFVHRTDNQNLQDGPVDIFGLGSLPQIVENLISDISKPLRNQSNLPLIFLTDLPVTFDMNLNTRNFKVKSVYLNSSKSDLEKIVFARDEV